MSEILTLAKTFKQKSSKQAELIEGELNTVMTKLNTSITKSLRESENIIKTGTAGLNEQNEQLQLMLKQHRDDTHTALSSYTSEVQALIGKGLSEHTEEIQTMIEGYTTAIETTIQETQSRAYQVIKSDMNKWLIMGAVGVLIMMFFGVILGVFIAKKVIDPTVIYYQEQPKTQPYVPYNP